MLYGNRAGNKLDKYICIDLFGKKVNISLLCAIAFLYFGRYSLLSFAKTFSISTALVGGSMLLLFVAALAVYTVCRPDNICWDGIMLVLFMILFFAVTLILHPEYMNRYLDVRRDGSFGRDAVFKFGAGIYTYYLIRLFHREGKKLYRFFRFHAYIILFFEIWVMFFARSEEYNLVFGYNLEMSAILFMAMYLSEKKNIHHLILSGAAIMAAVLYGARACIIGYVVFVAVYFIWKNRLDKKQIFLTVMGLIAAVSFLSPPIMGVVYSIFASMGLKSRTLYLLASGNIMAVDTSRQDKIWPILVKALQESSLFKMYGAFGDRVFLSMYYPYSHNLFLEILMTFGKVFGGAFIIWMFVQLIIVIRCNKDEYGLVTIILGCYSLCKLVFSNTFWQETYFWSFLAMLINCALQRRRVRNTKPPLSDAAAHETFQNDLPGGKNDE